MINISFNIKYYNYSYLHEKLIFIIQMIILKLSNNLFLIGEYNSSITQFKIANKELINVSYKNKLDGNIFDEKNKL